MVEYYYDGRSFADVKGLMRAVRNDLDFNLGDSEIDMYLRETGGVNIDGTNLKTGLALKRFSFSAYREVREEMIDWMVTEIREEVLSQFLPLQVPFTGNVIESDE